VEKAEYWDTPTSKIVQTLAFTKAVLAWCVANPPSTVFDNIAFYMCHPDNSQTK